MAKLPQLSRPSKRPGSVVRTWLAMQRQKQRRLRARAAAAVWEGPKNLEAYSYGFEVSLYWDMTGVGGEAWCVVEYRLVGDPDWIVPEWGTGAGDNSACFDVPSTGLWEFRVRAFRGTESSTYSNTSSCGTAPVRPAIQSLVCGSGPLEISWSYSGPDVDGFKVYNQKAGGAMESVAEAGPTEMDMVLSAPGQSGDYTYYVEAYNQFGSVYSDGAGVTVE